ncbi:hypothetical protein CT19431_30057 [Cupriavidus taiwanensis]|nr:hypothetical protein CT19431_30057 [Cupriavidus taiwanensis]
MAFSAYLVRRCLRYTLWLTQNLN